MLSSVFKFITSNQANNVLRTIKIHKFQIYSGVKHLHISRTLSAKIYKDVENSYCFSIIENFKGSTIELVKASSLHFPQVTPISTQIEFNNFLKQDFRRKNVTDIVNAFTQVKDFCIKNEINISDQRFDNLVDGLMDNVEKLTDNQLFELLDTLAEFPSCDGFKSHNFHDTWSALCDICRWKLNNWDVDTAFFVADKWYKLNLGKISDYNHYLLNKLQKKPKRLTTNQLVQAFFYLNVCRHKGFDFEFEAALENRIEEMTIDQIAIAALAFFKTETKVKIPAVLQCMIKKAMEEENVHEITLCAILKVIRFTANPHLIQDYLKFLDYLYPQANRLSILCLLHAALLGTTLQFYHKPIVTAAANRIYTQLHDVQNVRLKDIERLLLALSMFNYEDSEKPNIYEAFMKELHEERRKAEIVQHPKCLISSLQYLSIRGLYSYELMDRVLDPDFVTEVYGKDSRNIPRELFALDTNIDIECPDYKGKRLLPRQRYKGVKWLTFYHPTHDQQKKITAADKLILDVSDHIEMIVKDKKKMVALNVLPQFGRADIVLCRNKQGDLVVPQRSENFILGDIIKPYDQKNFDWFAVVVIGWNNTVRDTKIPVGYLHMKLRLLKKIGYTPIPVIWNEYMPLTTREKIKYFMNYLEE